MRSIVPDATVDQQSQNGQPGSCEQNPRVGLADAQCEGEDHRDEQPDQDKSRTEAEEHLLPARFRALQTDVIYRLALAWAHAHMKGAAPRSSFLAADHPSVNIKRRNFVRCPTESGNVRAIPRRLRRLGMTQWTGADRRPKTGDRMKKAGPSPVLGLRSSVVCRLPSAVRYRINVWICSCM